MSSENAEGDCWHVRSACEAAALRIPSPGRAHPGTHGDLACSMQPRSGTAETAAVLGSETRYRRWAGIRPWEVLLKPPAPQAPCRLDGGQAQQGSSVRPDRPAHASSVGVRPGLGGAQATCLPAAGHWAGSQGGSFPQLPPPRGRSRFPRPLSKRLAPPCASHPARTARDAGEGGPGTGLARSDERLGFDWIFIGDTSQGRAQHLGAESDGGLRPPSGGPADLLKGVFPQQGGGPCLFIFFLLNVN